MEVTSKKNSSLIGGINGKKPLNETLYIYINMQKGTVIVLNEIAKLNGMNVQERDDKGMHYFSLSDTNVKFTFKESRINCKIIAYSNNADFDRYVDEFNARSAFLLRIADCFPFFLNMINQYNYYRFNFSFKNYAN